MSNTFLKKEMIAYKFSLAKLCIDFEQFSIKATNILLKIVYCISCCDCLTVVNLNISDYDFNHFDFRDQEKSFYFLSMSY